MILITLFIVFWLIFIGFIYLFYALFSVYGAILFVFGYVCATRALERHGIQSLWLRDCALMRYLQRTLCDSSRVVKIHTERRVMYAVAPHGISCFGFAATFVPSVRGRVRVMASRLFLYAPLVRDIWFAAGVVTATRETFDACIARGENIAVIPSGVEGLYHEVITPVDHAARVINVYRVRAGFLALAIRHRMLLVPVLACGENNVYWKCTLLPRVAAFFTTLIWPRIGGAPHVATLAAPAIDCAHYEGRLAALDREYHRALRDLGKRMKYRVRIVDKPQLF
jgi:hypothetical protein